MTILALDPGLTKPGVAYYSAGRLWSAQRLRIPKEWSKLGILDRCGHVASAAFEWFEQWELGTNPILVVEWPRWYPNERRGIDPNDLAGLCAIAGALLGQLAEYGHKHTPGFSIVTQSPTPHEVWGTVPKATTGDPWKSPRGARLASRLTEVERAGVADYHDALDAAALSLWAAGRWKPRSNYPGAV